MNVAVQLDMPRKRHIISSDYPYHVSIRTNNKEFLFLNNLEIWKIMENYLFFIRRAFNVRIHSFVLMSNHFHLLISTPDGNLSESLQYFLRETSRAIGINNSRINHIYGQRYSRSVIKSAHHYNNVYKYIYANPTKSGICKKAEDYPFSTLYYKCAQSYTVIPYEYDEIFYENPQETLDWINQLPTEEDWSSIKLGLKKAEFQLPVNRKNRKPHLLEKYKI